MKLSAKEESSFQYCKSQFKNHGKKVYIFTDVITDMNLLQRLLPISQIQTNEIVADFEMPTKLSSTTFRVLQD